MSRMTAREAARPRRAYQGEEEARILLLGLLKHSLLVCLHHVISFPAQSEMVRPRVLVYWPVGVPAQSSLHSDRPAASALHAGHARGELQQGVALLHHRRPHERASSETEPATPMHPRCQKPCVVSSRPPCRSPLLTPREARALREERSQLLRLTRSSPAALETQSMLLFTREEGSRGRHLHPQPLR